MAELRSGNGIKAIAFYLPQFHPIPENDRAWGAGFTEWDNVKKARPLFPGQDQPRTPKGGNHYTLPDHDVQLWQAKLAREHRIFGFCYYHYWFGNGKTLLEKPVEAMLQWPDVDIPFCLSWANEPWTRRWDGGGGEIIVPQEYGGPEDGRAHFDYLLPFFRDRRYITLDGKPLLLIYKPEKIPRLKETLESWQSAARKAGFPGLCLMIQSPSWYFQPSFDMRGFDYQIRFQPFFSMVWRDKNLVLLRIAKGLYRAARKFYMEKIFLAALSARNRREQRNPKQEQTRLDYDALWETTLSLPPDKRMIDCACPDWDNTPRTKFGSMLLNASPEKFAAYLTRLCRKIKAEGGMPLLFLNAWNEWGEGAYLEPDEKHGDKYLKAVRQALAEAEKEEAGRGFGDRARV